MNSLNRFCEFPKELFAQSLTKYTGSFNWCGVNPTAPLTDPGLHALVLVAGMAAGFFNVLAGGGSLIAMPALILMGLPATTANGTLRLAILLQNVVALARYQRARAIDWGLVQKWALPLLLGAVAGAWAGSRASDVHTQSLLSGLMLIIGGSLIIRPGGTALKPLAARALSPALSIPLAAIVGFYGGAIQAGVGYLILGLLVLALGLPLAKANVLKIALVTIYTPLALGLFAFEGKIDWSAGALLAVGQAIGGWIAAGVALEKGDKFIRRGLAVAISLGALKLLSEL